MKTLRLIGNVTCTNDMLEGSTFYACMSLDQAHRVLKAAEAAKSLGARKIFLDGGFSIYEFPWLPDEDSIFMTSADGTNWPEVASDEHGDRSMPDDDSDELVGTGAEFVVTDGESFWYQTTSSCGGAVYLTDHCELKTLREFVTP